MSDIRVFDDRMALARSAADLFVESAVAAIESGGVFRIALAGGSTPRETYRTLASPDLAGQVEWARVHLFWGDERCVPPDHPDGNYKMVYDSLLSRVSVPEKNVHRMETDLPPSRAADLYSAVLKESFALAEGELPRFDLMLLGMGSDGHTASLFPGDRISYSTDRLVVASRDERHGYDRLSLTIPVINNSSGVVFLVVGREKARALSVVLEGSTASRQPTPHRESRQTEPGRKHAETGDLGDGRQPEATAYAQPMPAQMVAPRDDNLVWLVDRAAASGLKSPARQDE